MGLALLRRAMEATLAMEPELEKALDKVVAGPCFSAAELPTPRPRRVQGPGTVSAAGDQLEMMGVEDDVNYTNSLNHLPAETHPSSGSG